MTPTRCECCGKPATFLMSMSVDGGPYSKRICLACLQSLPKKIVDANEDAMDRSNRQ